jgi:hypothetical protein
MIGGGDLSRPMSWSIGESILDARVILRQFLHADSVAISYLFGCGGRARGAVVDPVGDIGMYLDGARDTEMKILYAIDTHISRGPRFGQGPPGPVLQLRIDKMSGF